MRIKKWATLFFMLLLFAFMRTENVFADEYDSESSPVMDRETSEDEGAIVFSTSENIWTSKEEISPAVSGRSSYEVVPYSRTFVTGCGNKDNVATIQVSGEVYFYDTGQVHLYSMKVSVKPIRGCTYSISDIDIINTDGSRSSGSVVVLLEYDNVELARFITVELKGRKQGH
ncbi:MAG: hypothetical protein K2P87_12420 [Lachnospiraceae bacterium]|nr:hypothetical protein [Lachnospiraceae bacterium]